MNHRKVVNFRKQTKSKILLLRLLNKLRIRKYNIDFNLYFKYELNPNQIGYVKLISNFSNNVYVTHTGYKYNM